LRKPLGLGFDWPNNERGWVQIGSQGPLPVIQATHRDIARLGLLWLARGAWNGEQLIDPEFIDESLRPAYPKANGAYGYLWWLNGGEGTWRSFGPSGSGRFIPEAPASTYFGLGARGKILVVVPDHDLVVVTMGDTAERGALPRVWKAIASFLPA
jgi:CubicO group peptidase (beta-lactamase class C family)